MHASHVLNASSVACASTPYVFGSAATDLRASRDASRAFVLLEGGRSQEVHACRYRPTARDVARDQRLRLRDVLVGLVVCMLVGAVIVSAIFMLHGRVADATTAAASSVTYEGVCVQQGDTLWELAEAHPVHGLTTQEVVELVASHNGISDAVIQPGQVLQVPMQA